ncbi:MAG: KilA-N domain-containing protein [Prevotella sp.]|nr:KilA-N domain-containing protein [Prevotella sp.]
MAKQNEIKVKTAIIKTMRKNGMDFISITDIAKQKNETDPNGVIANWMRNRNTIEFLGIWETLYNPNFNPLEFDGFRTAAGLNAFTLSPTRWVEATRAVGIVSQPGRYGGTYACSDIAFEFASWISVEFRLYLVKEFQRLKTEEQKQIGWSAKRELSKINYRIHTDAIKQHLIPAEVTQAQASVIYAEEADVLNVAMFGITARQWREANPTLKGNIRDYATINELICLSNMENINAVLIDEGVAQGERLLKLNQVAIQQMRVLEGETSRRLLTDENL